MKISDAYKNVSTPPPRRRAPRKGFVEKKLGEVIEAEDLRVGWEKDEEQSWAQRRLSSQCGPFCFGPASPKPQ